MVIKSHDTSMSAQADGSGVDVRQILSLPNKEESDLQEEVDAWIT